MVDIGQALLTAGLSSLGFVLLKFVGEPIHEQRRLKGRIAHALTFYANRFFIQGVTDEAGIKELHEVQTILRTLAADLRASRYSVFFYRCFEKVGLVFRRGNLQSAAAELIGWSNGLFDEGAKRFERRYRIGELLGMSFKDDVDVTEGTRDSSLLSSTEPPLPPT